MAADPGAVRTDPAHPAGPAAGAADGLGAVAHAGRAGACAWWARTRTRPRARVCRGGHAHRRHRGGLGADGRGGVFLTLSAFNAFFFNMVNGRGWICVALVVFASWRPGKALLGALLFGFSTRCSCGCSNRASAGRVGALPGVPDAALPAAIVALVLVARRAAYPQALMKPYRKGGAGELDPRHSAHSQRHAARWPHAASTWWTRPHRGHRAATAGPEAPGARAAGHLLSPPFVDPHFHMDATLSYGLPRVNRAAPCSKASRCGAS